MKAGQVAGGPAVLLSLAKAQSYVPQKGFVPDSTTAVKILEPS